MEVALALVGLVVAIWLWLRSSLGKRRRDCDTVARSTGHSSYSELQGSIALAARAGVVPTQAKTHRRYLVQVFGEPAVNMAASMILDATFDVRFKGQSLESALDTLSEEVPEVKIDDSADEGDGEASRTHRLAHVTRSSATPAQALGDPQSTPVQWITRLECDQGRPVPNRVVWPFLALAALLAVALLRMSPSYYGFLRLLVVAVSIYGLASGRSANWSPRLLVFGPPIVLWGMVRGPGRDFWAPFDLAGAVWFAAAAAMYRMMDYCRRRVGRSRAPHVRNVHGLAVTVLGNTCIGLSVALAISLSSSARSRPSPVSSSEVPDLHRAATAATSLVA